MDRFNLFLNPSLHQISDKNQGVPPCFSEKIEMFTL
jgi:hypothetical protein